MPFPIRSVLTFVSCDTRFTSDPNALTSAAPAPSPARRPEICACRTTVSVRTEAPTSLSDRDLAVSPRDRVRVVLAEVGQSEHDTHAGTFDSFFESRLLTAATTEQQFRLEGRRESWPLTVSGQPLLRPRAAARTLLLLRDDPRKRLVLIVS